MKARRVKRPASVLIGPITYVVQFDAELDDEQMGSCEMQGSIIRIADTCSDSMARATLWHESLHAICNVYGPSRGEHLNYYVRNGVRDQLQVEEMYVGFLESGVLCFVRDNPYAWAWILNTEAD